MMEFSWIIPLFPLLSFVLILFFGKKLKHFSAYLGIGFVGISFVLSIFTLIERFSNPTYKKEFIWIKIGESHLSAGYEVNQLNALMLFIVSLVSFLVHIYSNGYMKGDKRFPIFYGYLGLFTAAMLALVISPNLLQMYVFWELVGLGSFLLIGFYNTKESAKEAAKKAFIMTRIGDTGFLVGILLLYSKVGTFNFNEIFYAVQAGVLSPRALTVVGLLIFIGAMGKSGQFPLHTWLPDAMEGPTPVSALIHAATMVAAGVYLVATMFPLFVASKTILLIVSIIGGLTAIFAASIGLVQKDLKKILAYSTISQLGYMMLALGSAGYVAGVFHLTTHAFFKALLFLAAGSVIHAVHTQNIDEMGGLWRKMKFTAPLFLIGTLALTGIPLLSGFFSKDEILISVWNHGNPFLFIIAIVTAFMTSFYMFRVFFIVFFGDTSENSKRAHESSLWMIIPMFILGILAVVSGYINTSWFGTYLGNWILDGNEYIKGTHESASTWIMSLGVIVSGLGIYLAWEIYVRKNQKLLRFVNPEGTTYRILSNRYYMDEIYGVTVVPMTRFFSIFLSFIEIVFVKGIMKLVVYIFSLFSTIFIKIQNGQAQTYGAIAFLGLAIVIFLLVLTGGYFKWIL
ncbi:MAG: NADH-quinone oxidoreductase subunit [Bacillales bacterium]|nr:NADH-quinone oxidoreductase subunit [Bacillales bacterium]